MREQTRRTNRLLVGYGVVLVLAIIYLLQVFTPLRLNVDSIALLYLSESASQGTGFLDHGYPTPFPPGYPAMLVVLTKIGLAHPAAFVVLNIVLLTIGLVSVYYILTRCFFQQEVKLLNCICLTLLSWVVIRNCTFPLTDIAFFGIAMSALAALTYASTLNFGRKLALWIFISWLLIVVSIVVRRVGVALIPALIWTIVSHGTIRAAVNRLSAMTKAAWTLAFLGAGLAIAWAVSRTYTLHDFNVIAQGVTVSQLILQIFQFRMTELGELAFNLPKLKMPVAMDVPMALIGAIFLAFVIFGLVMRRKQIAAVDVFFVFYAGILFVWPYYDPRFWLPVIPLLIAYITYAFRDLGRYRWALRMVVAYEILFAVTGLVALGYSTKLTFAGARFPEEYVGGTMRDTYCAALDSCPGGFNPAKVEPRAFHLLQVYK